MAKSKMFVVVYRTGGTDNFKWTYTLAMSKSDAIIAAQDMRRGGYKCYVYAYEELLTIGVPDTYEAVK
jgi:hypothetical protein